MSSTETKIRVRNAYIAMKAMGFNEEKIKPALKSLLKLYKENWELIEEDNYRALAYAIFDNDNEVAEEFDEPSQASEETPRRPLKRLRLKYQDGQGSSSAATNYSGPPLKASQTVVEPIAEKNEGKQPSLDLSPLTDNAHLAISAVVKALAAAEDRAKRVEESCKKALLQIEQDKIELQKSNVALKKMEKEKFAVQALSDEVNSIIKDYGIIVQVDSVCRKG